MFFKHDLLGDFTNECQEIRWVRISNDSVTIDSDIYSCEPDSVHTIILRDRETGEFYGIRSEIDNGGFYGGVQPELTHDGRFTINNFFGEIDNHDSPFLFNYFDRGEKISDINVISGDDTIKTYEVPGLGDLLKSSTFDILVTNDGFNDYVYFQTSPQPPLNIQSVVEPTMTLALLVTAIGGFLLNRRK